MQVCNFFDRLLACFRPVFQCFQALKILYDLSVINVKASILTLLKYFQVQWLS